MNFTHDYINDDENLINDIQSGKLLPIAEKKIAIADEPIICGSPAYIIRLSGCNLKCRSCTIDDVSKVTLTLTPEELMNDIKNVSESFPGIKILICGGEPLMFNHNIIFNYIAEEINYADIYVKSNGTIAINDLFAPNIHYILECKTPSSEYGDSFVMNNLKLLRLQSDAVVFHASKSDLPYISDKIVDIYKIKPFIDIYVRPYEDLTKDDLAKFIITNKLCIKIH